MLVQAHEELGVEVRGHVPGVWERVCTRAFGVYASV